MMAYEVEGKVVSTLKELSEVLGEKVTKKDLSEGGKFHDVVSLVDADDAAETQVEDSTVKEDNEEKQEIYTALTEEDIANLEDVTEEDIKDTIPEFDTLEELKDFIKDLDTTTLEFVATALGLTWNPTYHKNIHRMRVAMALQKHFFPEKFKKTPKEPKAKYGDYSTDELFKMAEESGIEVKRKGNEKIDRLQVINKLKKAGHLE
ncbi:capsid and scaffold protein [Bacillus phage SP8]|nr:capsid and scaffold protein [Bacillus phage SP8]